MSNSFFLPAASISHTSTLNAERGQLSIAAARSARRRELKRQIGERASVVDRLIAVHTPPPPSPPAATPAADPPGPRLKRYREE